MKASDHLTARCFSKTAAAAAAVILTGLGVAAPAQAEDIPLVSLNVIADGTFTYPQAPKGGYATYGAGTRFGGFTGTAWVVTGGSVDHLSNDRFPPPAGSPATTQSVDLNGNEPGRLAQSVATIPNAQYTVSLAYRGNTERGCPTSSVVKSASVTFGGVQGPAVVQFAPPGSNSMWQSYSATFTASGSASDLVLAGTSLTSCGMYVTNVSVTQVPVTVLPLPGL